MGHLRLWHLGTAAALVALLASCNSKPYTGDTSRLVVLPETSTIDLGSGRPGEVKESVLTLRNEGSRSLYFNVRGSCTCRAEVVPTDGLLAPGQTVEVQVRFPLRHEGQREQALIRVETNDPKQPVHERLFTATSETILEITPPTLDFGTLLEGSRRTAHVTVRPGLGAQDSELRSVLLICDCPRVCLQELPSFGQWRTFAVTVLEGIPQGSFVAELRVVWPELNYAHTVQIRAEVVGPLGMAPVTLYFPGQSKNPETPRCGHVTIWRRDGQALGPLLDFKAAPGIAIEETSPRQPAEAARRTYRIWLAPDLVLGHKEEVTLRLRDFPKPVVLTLVPVPGRAEGGTIP